MLCASAFAATDPAYTTLRSAKPDGRTIAVSNFSFDRDAFHYTLTGTLHLLAQVNGKDYGAVFLGQGSYALTPATPVEAATIANFVGDDKLTTLSETFDRAVFLDAPLIAAAGKIGEGSPNSDAINAYEDFLKRERSDFQTNYHIRVLRELLDGPGDVPLSIVYVRAKYGPSLMTVDVSQREPVSYANADQTKGGTWYSAFLKSAYSNGSAPIPKYPVADHYAVDTTLTSGGFKGVELVGTTTISFTPNRDTRVLGIALMPKLRIEEASISPAGDNPTYTPVSWIQEKAEEDGNAAIVLPQALKSGEKYLLRMSYKGREAVEDAGDGNFTVGARESWYPNFGTYQEPAMYDLTFRFPAGKNQIIAVGDEVSSKDEGNQRVSVWKTSRPVRVAGFNYGKFKKLSKDDKDSGMTVDVYTNTGEPDIIRQINAYLSARSQGYGDDEDGPYVGPSSVRIDASSLAQSAFADGANTARTGKVYFGPLLDKRIAITQQSQWFFGQSWPGLVYLPYLAFVDGTTRNALGLNAVKDFVDVVGPHELAHQWWGHQVGWATYHDQWLSEGFAEFTAGLVVLQTKGLKGYDKFWENKRKSILEKGFQSQITNDKAGPISQGYRLATWRAPSAYDVIVYDKGAYVLHMLRMAMQDRKKPNPDQDFADMMTDFATTYAGKNPSTADFQRIVEKHIPATFRLTQDGKLDWFFQEWVFGTSIPKFTSKVDVIDEGGGKYKLSGNVTQSEVPNDFVSVLPLYIVFDKATVKIGSIPLIGNTTKDINVELALPQKPKGFAVNAMHDILAR